MDLIGRLWPGETPARRRELARMVAMFALFLLVVSAFGILRPVKNTLALDGLGESQFYRVYLVSAVVVLFVPIYNRLSDRWSWRWLIPGVAAFFAANLVAFRFLYREGSAAFGMVFYGWYDLFSAALVTQFFMATQLFFDTRDAKRAYPLVIAGGAIGASVGGAVSGFLSPRIGTPDLLLVAAAVVAVFVVGLPFVWADEPPDSGLRRVGGEGEEGRVSAGEFRALLRNPQVRLIAAAVLLTVLVKQLVDFQWNTLTEQAFQTRDAIAAFQGKFNAATQWLPILALAGLRPLLRRWGVGAAVVLFPAAVLLSGLGMAAAFTVWTATITKGLDTTLRYSAERTAREILYVPVPEGLKLRAKTYIDVGVEKGLGKVLSAGLIFALLGVMELRHLPWVTVGLAALLLGVALEVRREYVRTLARAIRGRFASLRGVFASIADASLIPAIREGLRSDEPLQVNFALDLVAQANPEDVGPLAGEVEDLLRHRAPEIRARALMVLSRFPATPDPDEVRARLEDPEPAVREAAVRTLWGIRTDGGRELLESLLESDRPPVRRAVLACLARGEIAPSEGTPVGRTYLEARRRAAEEGGAEERLELALAIGAFGAEEEAAGDLGDLIEDRDPEVARAAIRSAGMLGLRRYRPTLVDALGRSRVREAAADALAAQGPEVVPLLAARLDDVSGDPLVRRSLPSVLGRIPCQEAVDALLRSHLAPETDQLLDDRTLKALNKLRSRAPDLEFDRETALEILGSELVAANHYGRALALIRGEGTRGSRIVSLLERALEEALKARRETVFRCLGLVYPSDEVYRCYLAVVGGDRRARANALEWLEQTVGHRMFSALEPVVGHASARPGSAAEPESGRRRWTRLWGDNDHWIARLALRGAAEMHPEWFDDALADFAADAPALARVAGRLRESGADDGEGSPRMDLIEKVFLLQNVDLLRGARSSYLALMASIAEEVEADPGTTLIRKGDPTDALYIVIDGRVELRGVAGGGLSAEPGTAFGTWALIDEKPSLVGAETVERTRLLRIGRREFHDLLADHAELAVDLLRGLADRVRSLARSVGGDEAPA